MPEVYEARVVWRWYLREAYSRNPYATGSPLSLQMQNVLLHFDAWEREYPSRFNYYSLMTDNKPEELEYMEFLKHIFDDITRYFDGLVSKYRGIPVRPKEYRPRENGPLDPQNFYANLVASHIKVNTSWLKEADAKINAGQHRNDGRIGRQLWDTVFTERSFIYAENIPKVANEMERRGFPSVDVEDAW